MNELFETGYDVSKSVPEYNPDGIICIDSKLPDSDEIEENLGRSNKKLTNEQKINDMNARARKYGMSYGQFVAYLSAQEERRKRLKGDKI